MSESEISEIIAHIYKNMRLTRVKHSNPSSDKVKFGDRGGLGS